VQLYLNSVTVIVVTICHKIKLSKKLNKHFGIINQKQQTELYVKLKNYAKDAFFKNHSCN